MSEDGFVVSEARRGGVTVLRFLGCWHEGRGSLEGCRAERVREGEN